MRVGLLADIHGNAPALEAVLRDPAMSEVDQLIILGDLVGYYFWPAEVLAALEPLAPVIVRGNHEDMLAEAAADPAAAVRIAQQYGSGIDVALQSLSSDQLAQLVELPHPVVIEAGDAVIVASHGSPADIDRYVYPTSTDAELAQIAEPRTGVRRYIAMGHTHHPMTRTVGEVTLVNPGSVGQPRNRVPGAHWAILDTDTGETIFRVEDYDVDLVVREAVRRHPDIPYLHDVLVRT